MSQDKELKYRDQIKPMEGAETEQGFRETV